MEPSTHESLVQVEDSLLHVKGDSLAHVAVFNHTGCSCSMEAGAVFNHTGCSCSMEAGAELGEASPVDLVQPDQHPT